MPPCFPLPAEFFVWSLHPLLESLCIFALLHSLRFVHETGCSLSSFAPSRRRARDAAAEAAGSASRATAKLLSAESRAERLEASRGITTGLRNGLSGKALEAVADEARTRCAGLVVAARAQLPSNSRTRRPADVSSGVFGEADLTGPAAHAARSVSFPQLAPTAG